MPGRVVPLPTTARLLGEAAAAFLAQPDLAASTRRSYQQTLGRLEREFGADQPLTTLTTEQMTAAVTGTWAGRAPATWNRHVATVRSFFGFCRRRRWLIEDLTVDLEHPVPAHVPAAVDRCPDTGRARLSYRRAEALFRQASGGWTLHQLRPQPSRRSPRLPTPLAGAADVNP